MPRYIVIEKLTIVVAHGIEADTPELAKAAVEALTPDKYDAYLDYIDSNILSIVQISDPAPAPVAKPVAVVK